MNICPRCGANLVAQQTRFGIMYGCPRCKGRCVGLPVLRNAGASPVFLRDLWMKTREANAPKERRCPFCGQMMAKTTSGFDEQALTLDTCKLCQTVWFDTKEFESLPFTTVAAPKKTVMSPKAREAVAMSNLKRLEEQSQRMGGADAYPEGWQWLPAILGMPVECDAPKLTCLPYITWASVLICILATLPVLFGNMFEASQFVEKWGFIPSQWYRHGGLTLITSFFLHGGALHLAGNMYFLAIFGDNVEDHLKRSLYLVLLMAGHVAGLVLHGALDPRANVPLVGASAGISGVIAYYTIAYPEVRIGFFFRYWFYLRFVRIPVAGWLALFVLMQLVGVFLQVKGLSNVSALGHMGGVIIGILLGALVYFIRSAPRKAVLAAQAIRREGSNEPR